MSAFNLIKIITLRPLEKGPGNTYFEAFKPHTF